VNTSEFREWTKQHSAAFPGIRKWFAEHQETVAHWQAAMVDVDLEAARQATCEMLSGDLEAPRGYSEHVRTVRRRAKELQLFGVRAERDFRRIDGEEVFDCALCRDSGFVLVLDSGTGQALLDWARNGEEGVKPPIKPTSVACECEAGSTQIDSYRTRKPPREPREVARYDPTRVFRMHFQWVNLETIELRDGTCCEGLLEWMERKNDWLASPA
jgi:hypothetical protein